MVLFLIVMLLAQKPSAAAPSGTALRQAGIVCYATCVIRRGVAFSLAADHSGQYTTGYRVYTDGVQVGDLPVSALVTPPGVITFAFTNGLSRGSHELVISAYDNLGHEAKSDPLLVRASPNGK